MKAIFIRDKCDLFLHQLIQEVSDLKQKDAQIHKAYMDQQGLIVKYFRCDVYYKCVNV